MGPAAHIVNISVVLSCKWIDSRHEEAAKSKARTADNVASPLPTIWDVPYS